MNSLIHFFIINTWLISSKVWVSFFSRKSIRSIGNLFSKWSKLIRWIESPRTFFINIEIELSFPFPKFDIGNFNSNNITNSTNNCKVYEMMSKNYYFCIIFLIFGVESRINNLKTNDVEFILFVRIVCIYNYSIKIKRLKGIS